MKCFIYFLVCCLLVSRVFSATCPNTGAPDETPQVNCQADVNLVTLPGVCFATYTPAAMNYFIYPEIATGVPFPGSPAFGAQDTRFSTLSQLASTVCTTGTFSANANFIVGVIGNGAFSLTYNANQQDQLYTCLSTTLNGASFDPVTNGARYYWAGSADDRTVSLGVNGVVNSLDPSSGAFAQFNFPGPTASGNILLQYTFQNNCPGCGGDNPTGSRWVLHGANFRLTPIGYTDNCGSQPTLTYNPPAQVSRTGPSTPFVVTASATDSQGQTGSCSYNVFVIDNQPPVITACPAFYQVYNDPGLCSAVVNIPADVTATDNCGFTISTAPIAVGSPYPIGETPTTITVTDVEGLTDTCQTEVIVVYRYQCPASVLSVLSVNSVTPVVTVSGSTSLSATNLCDTPCGQFSGQAQAIYSFTGPSGGIYGVDVQLLSSNFAGAGFAVFRCGVDFMQICDQTYSTSMTTVDTIPGAIYYVVVFSQTPGASGTFTLQLSVNQCAVPNFS